MAAPRIIRMHDGHLVIDTPPQGLVVVEVK